jgi:hypothetical protein
MLQYIKDNSVLMSNLFVRSANSLAAIMHIIIIIIIIIIIVEMCI